MTTFPPDLILEVARSKGLPLQRVGQHEFATRCWRPEAHRQGDTHPSCRLNDAKGTFYCDPCGRGGGIKEFAEALGVDLSSLLASRTGRSRGPSSRTAVRKAALLFESDHPISPTLQRWFAQHLGKTYSSETWAAFGVLEGWLITKGLPGKPAPAIAFPQPNGGFHIYLYKRQAKKRRWCFSKASKPDLLTVGLEREDPVLLCEGEWDAMRAYEIGFPVATGTGGAGTFRDQWGPSLRSRFVASAYDVDPAGDAGALNAQKALAPHAAAVWRVRVPLSGDPERDGKDLSDFVALQGEDALRELIAASIPARVKATRGCVREGASTTAAELVAQMEDSFPSTGPALFAGLAVHGYLALAGSGRPLCLFFVGPPSSGKTLADRMFLPVPEGRQLEEFVYRCDDFTPASFVSRAANIKPERLAEIDLLPKIENKVLNTKELAPIFRGKEDDLVRTFAILTSILDGDGYVTAGGSVGTRGYDRPIFFCWLGATTPFSSNTWRIMSALGPRVLFFNTDAPEPSIDELVRCQREDATDKETPMRLRVNGFLLNFFRRHPPQSVAETSIACPEEACRQIAVYAQFIARLRASLALREQEGSPSKEARYAPPLKEQEHRLVKTLNRLARGSALVMGRSEVGEDDLWLIRHIAISSAPETRRKVAQALIELSVDGGNGGSGLYQEIPIRDVADRAECSIPTARHYAQELHVLRVAVLDRVGVGCSDGSTLTLHEDFGELLLFRRTHKPLSLSTSSAMGKSHG